MQEAQVIEVLPLAQAEASNDIPAAPTEGLQPHIEADEDEPEQPKHIRVNMAKGFISMMVEQNRVNLKKLRMYLIAVNLTFDQVKDELSMHERKVIEIHARKNQQTG